MKALYEELADVAVIDHGGLSLHSLKVINAASITLQDAREALQDNERVIAELRLHIANLESFAIQAKDKCFEIYMNLSGVLPFVPVKDEKPLKSKPKKVRA